MPKSSFALRKNIHIALVQTNLDEHAWQGNGNIAELEQEQSWHEIKAAFRSFQGMEPKPDLILLPEVSVPRGRLPDLERFAVTLNAAVIAGIDFRHGDIDSNGFRRVWNEAAVIVPDRWGQERPGSGYKTLMIGKADPARIEKDELTKLRLAFQPDPRVWLLDGGPFGVFGVALCSDVLDLERALMYKLRVDHYLVLSYNKDLTSFRYLAEGYMRTIFCNVLVCNTGFYGGSLALSPLDSAHLRTAYRHEGNELFAHQVVSLRVADLRKARLDEGKLKEFKDTPPRRAGGGALELLTYRTNT